jgi:hypothetical protein
LQQAHCSPVVQMQVVANVEKLMASSQQLETERPRKFFV